MLRGGVFAVAAVRAVMGQLEHTETVITRNNSNCNGGRYGGWKPNSVAECDDLDDDDNDALRNGVGNCELMVLLVLPYDLAVDVDGGCCGC